MHGKVSCDPKSRGSPVADADLEVWYFSNELPSMIQYQDRRVPLAIRGDYGKLIFWSMVRLFCLTHVLKESLSLSLCIGFCMQRE